MPWILYLIGAVSVLVGNLLGDGPRFWYGAFWMLGSAILFELGEIRRAIERTR